MLVSLISTIASSNTDGTVKANGINIIVIGTNSSHTFPVPACPVHVANLNAGSSTVRVNSISVGRIGDSARRWSYDSWLW